MNVSAFAPNFVTPRVQQASLTLEREVADHTTIAISYLYVHGEHLIRALDVNLPQPVALTYPIFDSTGSIFENGLLHRRFFRYLAVHAIANLPISALHQSSRTPDCATGSDRRIPKRRLQRIQRRNNLHQPPHGARHLSASFLHLRASHRRRSGRPRCRRARHRAEFLSAQRRAWPKRHRPAQPFLRCVLRRAASLPPRTPTPRPHLQRLENFQHRYRRQRTPRQRHCQRRSEPGRQRHNDRLPGYSRNAFTGPDYSSTDLRLVRKIHVGPGYRLEFTADSFNLFNRDNQRVTITSDGLTAEATTFTAVHHLRERSPLPAYYQQPQNFLKPNAAFAPRQIQLGLKFIF